MSEERWLIWSNEHRAWWGGGGWGYTTDTLRAGRYAKAAAEAIVAQANFIPRDPPNEVMVLAPEPPLAVDLSDPRPIWKQLKR